MQEEEVILKEVEEARGGETQGQGIVKRRSASQWKIPRDAVSSPEVTDGFGCSGIQRPRSQVEGREARSVRKEIEPCIQASS